MVRTYTSTAPERLADAARRDPDAPLRDDTLRVLAELDEAQDRIRALRTQRDVMAEMIDDLASRTGASIELARNLPATERTDGYRAASTDHYKRLLDLRRRAHRLVEDPGRE